MPPSPLPADARLGFRTQLQSHVHRSADAVPPVSVTFASLRKLGRPPISVLALSGLELPVSFSVSPERPGESSSVVFLFPPLRPRQLPACSSRAVAYLRKERRTQMTKSNFFGLFSVQRPFFARVTPATEPEGKPSACLVQPRPRGEHLGRGVQPCRAARSPAADGRSWLTRGFGKPHLVR